MELAARILLGTVAVTAAAAATGSGSGSSGGGANRCPTTAVDSVLLQVRSTFPETSAGKAQDEDENFVALQTLKGRHHKAPPVLLQAPVDWKFTTGDPEAIKQWIEWDQKEGWSAPSRPGINLSDLAAWPSLKGTPSGWDFGLRDPQYFVLSMPPRVARRQRLKQQLDSLCLGADVEWAPAIDGSKIPIELRWMNGFEDKEAWDYIRPGNWACYASHVAILQQAHAGCPDCDVVVFEDDIVFAPDFKSKWTSFLSSLPADWELLRIGAQSQWEPPFQVTADYIHSRAVSNTWGYVVRARSVDKLVKLLLDLPMRGNWGIDAVFQLFNKELPMYSPLVPLVQAVGVCHDTEKHINKDDCETPEILQEAEEALYQAWPLGYARTYCRDRGLVNAAPGRESCSEGDASDTCCPYGGTVPRGLLSGGRNTC